jgi:hypothetical protein
MPNPEMLDGMRAPRSARLEDIRKSSESLGALPSAFAPAGVTVYVSRYRKYRVQVTAPSAYIDPASGRKNTGGKMHVAEFDEGIFRNDNRDPAVRALFDESLQANPYFGPFSSSPKVHFWLASDQNAKTQAASVESAKKTLASLPREQVEQFLAELKQGESDDHAVPAPDAEVVGKRKKAA